MRRLLCLLAALCLLAGCAAPAAPVEQPVKKPAAQQPAEEAPTETAPAEAPAAPAPTDDTAPVLTCGEYAMTSAQFQYYFGRQCAAVRDAYGSKSFDLSKDLDAQSYDGQQSWAAFLTEQAFGLAEQTQMLCLAAQAAGFAPVEGEPITDETARSRGYADAQTMLTALYGEGAEPEGYAAFARDLATSEAYSETLGGGEHTEAELEAYYDAHAEEYKNIFHVEKNDDRPMDVRIIRFYPNDLNSDADWQSAEERARAAETEFRKDPTDEKFAALADERTEDFKSPAGGLYPGLGPEGKGPLAEWLFPDEGTRAAGDLTLLRESDAWALCYVSALGERTSWQLAVEQDLRRDDCLKALDALRQTYVFQRYPENIDLRAPTAHNAERFAGVEAVG